MNSIRLINEDFSSFNLGSFPYDLDHSAMGEYHYYPEKGYKGIWFDPIADWDYKGPSWMITSSFLTKNKIMESQRLVKILPRKANPTLRAGDIDWKDYTFSVAIRPLINDERAGVLFRYQTSLMHYGVFFINNKIIAERVEKEERTELASATCPYSFDAFYTLKIVAKGTHFECFVNNELYLSFNDDRYLSGCIALSSCIPSQYSSCSVDMDKNCYKELNKQRLEKENSLNLNRTKYPKMKLWKQYDLKDFGAGRQLRVGHLLGTEELFFVICQHQRRVYKDRYPFISCMTAVSFKTGKVLWQLGTPIDDEDVIQLTTDLPFQVYDINNDGIDEVICCFDNELAILSGPTGSILSSIKTPLNDDDPSTVTGLEFNRFASERLNVDAIRIINVSGKSRPSDILIKDRYSRLWVYDSNLTFLWKFSKYNTGHFPYNFDFDKDGKDEIFSCYNLVNHDGKLIWSLPITTDHTDEIIIGKFNPDWDDTIAMVSGWEGFILVSKQGEILLKDINGHGQRISIGSYFPEKKGLQICTTTYWGNNGIVYMHECDGTEIWHKEMLCNGNVIIPINWDGSGKDLLLLNGSSNFGGLIDGKGDVVVKFPEDNHPNLSCEALDITGDNREEIIVWDRKTLWVYTQESNICHDGEKIYSPIKYPSYNASNYRGEYSFPNWIEK